LEHIATRYPVPLGGGYRGPLDQDVDVVWLAGVLEETGQACAEVLGRDGGHVGQGLEELGGQGGLAGALDVV